MRTPRRSLSAVVALVLGAGATLALASCSRDETDCASMSMPVRYQVDPRSKAGLFTTTARAADQADAAGYTTDQGTVFDAAPQASRGLVAVRQLRLDQGSGDQLWTTSSTEAHDAVQRGYTDQGVVAYVSPTPAPCTVEVERFASEGVHRYATTPERKESLRAAGWNAEGSFYAAKPRGVAVAGPDPTANPSEDPTPVPSGDPTPGPSATPSAGQPGVRTLIDATFDDDAPGPVTPESFAAALGRAPSQRSAYDSMTYLRHGDGQGSYVRTHLAADRFLGHNDRHGDGNVLVVPLPDQSLDSACVAYDVRFSRGFDFSAGGKLPGLLGVAPGVSPGTPTGGGSVAHGWSGRVMWLGPKLWRQVRESGQPNLAVTYLYHPGQAGTYGDDLGWNSTFSPGTWHHVEQCYTLNTVGEADGTLRVRFDDVPVLERTDLVYRTDPAVHITHLDWSVFRGGDTAEWASDTGGDVDLDDVVVTSG